MANFTVYILKSSKDSKRYIGFTSNLKKRLQQHEQGLVKSTRARLPFKLIHLESFPSKTEALRREKFLKTGKGREWMKLILGA